MFIKATAVGVDQQTKKRINYTTLIAVEDISAVISSVEGTTVNLKGGGVLSLKEGMGDFEKALETVLAGEKVIVSCQTL